MTKTCILWLVTPGLTTILHSISSLKLFNHFHLPLDDDRLFTDGFSNCRESHISQDTLSLHLLIQVSLLYYRTEYLAPTASRDLYVGTIRLLCQVQTHYWHMNGEVYLLIKSY